MADDAVTFPVGGPEHNGFADLHERIAIRSHLRTKTEWRIRSDVLNRFVTTRGAWVRHGARRCHECWDSFPGIDVDPFSPTVVDARRSACARANQLWWAMTKSEERMRDADALPDRLALPWWYIPLQWVAHPLTEMRLGGEAPRARWRDWRRYRRWDSPGEFVGRRKAKEIEHETLHDLVLLCRRGKLASEEAGDVGVRLLRLWSWHPARCASCGDREQPGPQHDDVPAMVRRCVEGNYGCDRIAALWWALRRIDNCVLHDLSSLDVM